MPAMTIHIGLLIVSRVIPLSSFNFQASRIQQACWASPIHGPKNENPTADFSGGGIVELRLRIRFLGLQPPGARGHTWTACTATRTSLSSSPLGGENHGKKLTGQHPERQSFIPHLDAGMETDYLYGRFHETR